MYEDAQEFLDSEVDAMRRDWLEERGLGHEECDDIFCPCQWSTIAIADVYEMMHKWHMSEAEALVHLQAMLS
jgi:hypothetical protein